MIINIYDTYQLNAYKTLRVPTEKQLPYCLCGIAGEVGELAEKILDGGYNLQELESECGDTFWYCATSSYLLGVTFSKVFRSTTAMDLKVFPINTILIQMLITATKIAELSKKELRQGLTANQKEDIIKYIGDITSDLAYLIMKLELRGVQEIFDQNLNEKIAHRIENGTLFGMGDNR